MDGGRTLSETDHHSFFTSPWEAMARRRGDALGLREAAERFSEILAPGLSNATADARWITLLSWCLKWSHKAWTQASGGDLTGREGQRQRYAWLRPLELLWIARSLTLDRELAAQLRGRRSVTRWLKDEEQADRFSMSDDQFRRYRQTGTYGAYRTIFRGVPGLTLGEKRSDGWTPSKGVNDLATYVDECLPRPSRIKDSLFESGNKWACWKDKEEHWWREKGWPGWDSSSKPHFLPTPIQTADRLPTDERTLLKALLFSKDSRRRLVVEVLAGARKVSSHSELCDVLVSAPALQGITEFPALRFLSSFTRLADAGMEVVRELWSGIRASDDPAGPSVASLVGESELQKKVRGLAAAAKHWNGLRGTNVFDWSSNATALAQAVVLGGSPERVVRALIRHHETYGGGLRWFRLHQGRVEPLLPENEMPASDYRFRLWPLARLAAQCGIANMHAVLEAASSGAEAEDSS